MAIGVAALSTGNSALAVGRQSAATGDYAQALGNVSAATGKGSLAVGHSATAKGNRSIAIGSADIDAATSTDPNQQGTDYQTKEQTLSTGKDSIAIGAAAEAAKDNALAVGAHATAEGKDSTAMGYKSLAKGDDSFALGRQAKATENNSFAMGASAEAAGKGSYAMGAEAKASGENSFAMGGKSQASAENALAIGGSSIAKEANSIAVGVNAKANFANSVALGTGAEVNHLNSVSIGENSKTNDYTTTAFLYEEGVAGAKATGAVSVGTVGNERRLQNIAAGSLDTDGVNVSQLKKHKAITDKTGDDVADHLGGGSTYNITTGDITAPTYNILGKDYKNVGDALAAAQTHYVSINDSGTPEGNYNNDGAEGIRSVAIGVNAKAQQLDSVALGHSAVTTGENATAIGANTTAVGFATAIGTNSKATGTDSFAMGFNSQATETYALAVGAGTYASAERAVTVGGSVKAKDSISMGIDSLVEEDAENSVAIGDNTAVTAKGGTVVGAKSDINAENGTAIGSRTSVNAKGGVALGAGSSADREATGSGSVYTTVNPNQSDLDRINATKSKDFGAVSVGYRNPKDASDYQTRQITNVAAGSEDSDAVNVAQLNAVNNTARNARTEVVAGENIQVDVTDGDVGKIYTVATKKDASFDSVSINNGGPIINVGGINMGDKKITNLAPGKDGKDAVNVDQLTEVKNTAEKGWNVSTDSAGKTSQVKPGDTVKFNGDNNITVSNEGNNVKVELSKNLNVDSIGLNGKDGKDGLTLTSGAGKPGVDGQDGVTRIIYEGQEVATLNDGMKFAGNDGKVITKKLNEQLDIVGGMDSTEVDAASAANIRTVKNGEKLEIQLSNDLKGLNSVNTTNLTVEGETKLGDNFIVNNEGAKYTGPITDGDHITNKTYVDGKVGAVAETPLTFAGNSGTPVAKKLGETMNIKGSGKKADTEYSAENIKTTVDADGNLIVAMDKNLKADSLALNGKDGKDGLTITSGAGKPGVDGKDGVTRIIYEGQEVATLNDGLTFVGNDGEVITKKLNEQLGVVGGMTDLTADAASSENIRTVKNAKGELEVQLSKKLTGLTEVNTTNLTVTGETKLGDNFTVNNEGATYTGPITNGDHITNKTYVDGKVGEVADTPLTFAGNNGSPVEKRLGETLDIIGGLADGKSSSAENIRTVTNDKGQLELQLAKNLTGLESVTVEDANGNKTYISPTGTSVRDVLGNSSSMVAGGTVVEDIAGNRTTMSSGVVNIKDGHGTTIVKGDGLTINDGPAFTSSKVDVAGNKIINVAAGTNLTDAVNVSQLKEAGNELTAKGLNFAGNSGEFHRDLGQKVTIKGEGTKGDDQYTGQSVKTIADADGNITVMIDKNFKSETVTTNEITLAGKDGINGKDGISLKASDGAPGLDGKPGNSRIIYKKPDGSTEEVATLNDGLKFKGNQGKAIDKKLNQQLEIVGGLADGKTSSAENIRTVTNDEGQLEIQLAKNLTGLESAKIGDVFINGKTNTIEGLSNKDFSAKDFATKGRSATEEQLKLVKDAQQETDDYAVKYDKKDGKVNRDSVTLGGTTANSTQATDGRITTTGGTSLSNVATAGDYTDVKNASNGVNAGDLNNAVIDVTNKGLSFAGNSGSPVQKKLGETLDIVGGLADGKTSSAENIRTVTNDKGQLEIQLAKNLTGLESAKIGEVFINGKTNTIEGLSNKDFSAKDFATKGRSATEEQLKLVKDAQAETDDFAVKYDKKDGKVNRDSVTLGGTTAISTIGEEDNGRITTTGGTSLTNVASAGDYTDIKNANNGVNAGDLNNAVIDVTNKGLSFAANTGSVKKKLGETLDIVGGMDSKEETAASAENIRTVMNDEGQLEIQLAKNLTGLESAKIGEVFINGKTNTIEGLSNITLGGDDFATKGRAATEEQLNAAQNNLVNIFGIHNAVNNGGIITFTDIGNTGHNNIHDAIASINDKANNANQGWNLSANGEGKTAVKPGSTVDFTGDGKNINVSKDDKNNIKVELGKDIDLGKDGSIKAGDTTINKDGIKTGDTTINGDGLTIAGGPSVTKDGIDAGGKKITGVEDGTIAAGSKDAVNGGQLHDAIGKATAEAKTEVKAGNNITVKKDKGANGQDVYEVATSDDVKFKNVETDNLKVGDVNIGKGGINAGGTVISGVKDGAVNKDSKEAVNGSQLNSSNQKNAEFFGGGTKYENGEWTAPTYNVNGGSYHNVGDALGALNEADKNLGDRITNLGDRVDQGFYQTNKRIGDVEKAANAGIAAAMALESAPFVAGKYTYAAGASYHGGEQAIGVTLRKTSDNGRWSITGGVAAATEGDASFRIGVSGVID